MNILHEKRRVLGHHRPCFGGGSSSSSAQTTTQTDNRRTIAAGGISNENGTVNVLDGGAIKNSFDFSQNAVTQALQFAGKNQTATLDFASNAQAQALDSLTTTSNLVKDAYADAKGRGAMTDKILIGAVAMAGLVAVTALRSK